MKDRLIVALDVDSFKKAKTLVDTLYPTVKIFKIGNQLFTKEDSKAIEMVHKRGAKVFLDLKFNDIPNTVSNLSNQNLYGCFYDKYTRIRRQRDDACCTKS